ncbi:MAG: 16S rRNA (cytosine(967)-C(5))-methyltransferase RsmB [Clostridia bacterium]|nr:16S rRNA (cytosine(967)-C(5))-methyltransferase RsmB [Clostridia bacterium]
MPNNDNRQTGGEHTGSGVGTGTRDFKGKPGSARKGGDGKRFGSKFSGSSKGRTYKKTFGSDKARTGEKPDWKRSDSQRTEEKPRLDGKPEWKRTDGPRDEKRPRPDRKPEWKRTDGPRDARNPRPDGKPEWKRTESPRDEKRPRPDGQPEWKRTDGPRDEKRPRKDGKPAWKRADGPREGKRRPDGKPAWKVTKPADGADGQQGDARFGQDRKNSPEAGLAARRVALETLLDVSARDAYAQLALEKHLKSAELDLRDTAFVTRMVYGTIENRISLDYRINQVLEKPDELDPTVREILRLGAYQLFYMDRVPDMAATDESVRLTRVMGMEGLTGLVNGVLRNMIREKENIEWPKPEDDPVRYLSIMYSAPEALCRMLIDRFGEHEAMEILRYRQPRLYESVRPNLMRCDDQRMRRMFADIGYTFEPGLVSGTYRVYDPGDLVHLRGYQNGLFVIQGESSVIAARAVGAKPGQTILDACAAPGGKTALISEMMQDTGRVYAWDTHPHRVELIRSTASRLHLENIRPICRDAQEPRPEQANTLDAAIIDAPCSGSGVMSIKPDLKYRITPEGVESLAGIQANILNAVADMVKPGGTLVYSTCSIFPEENELQVTAFLERHPEYRVSQLGELLPEALRPLEGEHGIQLFAHRDNIDGFYICRMIKA